MKPKITKTPRPRIQLMTWLCASTGGAAYGETPRLAYRNWENAMRTYARGQSHYCGFPVFSIK